MATGIDVKMGVTGTASFKQAMSIATQNVKTLDAALKQNEKQLQATGDKEVYMRQKTELLQKQIAQQTTVVKQGQQALQQMEKNGVDPASAAYQRMQQQVLNAQTALLGMQTDLSAVGQSAGETAQQTDKLTNSLNSINKKVSFDAVLNGIGKITDGMEAAARKVASLATNVWETMLSGAQWADDLSTQAEMYGITTEQLQRMEKTAQSIQTPVSDIMSAKQKVEKAMHDMPADVLEAFDAMGFVIHGKNGELALDMSRLVPGDTGFDFLFEIGDALSGIEDDIWREVYAQKVLGMSWQTLVPLINKGKDAYMEVYNSQRVVSEENVENLNELSSKVKDMEGEFETLKHTVEGELAGAFSTVAGAIAEMLGELNAYLASDEGKQKMEDLGEAVTKLFEGLTDVDFGTALETAKGWLDGITGALGWIDEHWDDVVTGIKAIGGAFIGLKAAEIVGTLVQSTLALKNLFGGGAGKDVGDVVSDGIGGGLFAGLGAKLAGGAKAIGAFLGKAVSAAVPWLGPIAVGALAIGGVTNDIIQEQRLQEEARAERARRIAVREELTQAGVMADTGYAEIYNLFSDLDASGANPYEALAERYRAWWYEDAEDKALDALLNITDDNDRDPETISLFDRWAELIEGYLNGNNVYDGTQFDVWEQMRKAIEEAGKEQMLQLPAELDPDTAALQETLNQAGLTVPVTPVPVGADGSNANGLPFVPFDGYISILHRGERVVPANQNRSYTTNSNVYFDHVNVNGGVDADGLAARIAERTRRTMAGFGG